MLVRALAAVVLLGTALSGCASIIKGSSEDIALNTTPVSGASCSLKNGVGEWTASSTPATVKVERSKTNIQVHCSKQGYQDGTTQVASGFQLWTLGNVLIGGLIGVGIDWGTGAINDYPSTVNVPMAPVTGDNQAPPPAAENGKSATPTS